MRQGEIWDYVVDTGGRTRRYLVVSSDDWNETAPPQCVPLLRRHDVPEVIPFLVLTNDADPVSGVLDFASLAPLDRSGFGEQAGMLTGATMAKVTDSLRSIYDI